MGSINKHILSFSLTVSAICLYGQKSHLWNYIGTQPEYNGSYKVGFRDDFKYDYSRAFLPKTNVFGEEEKKERSRPLQISMWYPASVLGEQIPMNYEEYIHLIANELEKQLPTSLDKSVEFIEKGKKPILIAPYDEIKQKTFKEILSWGIDSTKLDRERTVKTTAYRNATPAKGKFPIILYATSFSAPSFENSILCEFLASNGYVVIAVPSMGMNSREMTGDMKGIESQVSDLEFLINYLSTVPFADIDNIGIAGFSWGGLSNVFLQNRNNKIKAVISYDGSIANKNGLKLCDESPFCDFNQMDVPFMYLSQKGRKTNPYYDSLKYSNAYYFVFNTNRHIDFSSMFIRMVSRNTDEDRENLLVWTYNLQCEFTLDFFNAYLKADTLSLNRLDNEHAREDIADTLLTFYSKKGMVAPPNQEQFMALLEDSEFEKAKTIFSKVKQDNPTYSIVDESKINSLGYRMLRRKKQDLAIELFEFNTWAFPRSANTWDSLGDAYQTIGSKEKAIKSYKKAIEIDPNNASSKKKLEKLESQ